MRKKVLIIGSGKHAKVVAYNLLSENKYDIAGFVTTDKIGQSTYLGYPLFDSFINFDKAQINNLKDIFKTDLFHIGFGSTKYRKLVFNFFIENVWEPVNIIHPSAVISPYAKLGNGILIEAGCLITSNPMIGNNILINTGSQINHDNIVHNHVHIASGVILSGSVEIGENTLLDDGVIVTKDRKIGSNCIIGAGSVVTKNIPDNKIAYGIPCKIIRDNS